MWIFSCSRLKTKSMSKPEPEHQDYTPEDDAKHQDQKRPVWMRSLLLTLVSPSPVHLGTFRWEGVALGLRRNF